MRRLCARAALAAIAIVGGCSDESLPTTTPAKKAGPDEPKLVDPRELPPAKREVMVRSPLGSTPTNLLFDGDVEMSTERPEEMEAHLGWRAFDAGNAAVPIETETGGLCRSGLRCAVLRGKASFFVVGTAAPGMATLAGVVWTRPPSGTACNDVAEVGLIRCDDGELLGAMKATSDAPDASGWCEHRGAIRGQDASVCLFVDGKLASTQAALVDAATLLPDDGSARGLEELWTPETSARAETIARRVREGLRFGRPP